MADILFPKYQQLCDSLVIDSGVIRCRPLITNAQKNHLPGCPHIQLNDTDVISYLQKEFLTKQLERLAPRLWLMAKQDSAHISSLTEQNVRGRKIIVTENPKLHLVWIYDKVFIKPLPEYLLSRVFWDYYPAPVSSQEEAISRSIIRKAALGFLRSYVYLIQHRSDFTMAKDEKAPLIPGEVKYSEFMTFISHCKFLDEQVSPRFHFGELRLTRLNFWTSVFFQGFNYRKVEWQYGGYLAQYYGPLLFLFATFSVLVSALQVIIAVESLESNRAGDMKRYRDFCILIMYVVTTSITALAVLIIVMAIREVSFTLRDLLCGRKIRSSL